MTIVDTDRLGDRLDALFRAEGLSKRYGPNTVLGDVAFEIRRNRVVSFVGENGAGKSTLLNILTGVAAADSGRMWLNCVPFHPADYGAASRLGVSRVFQEQALVLLSRKTPVSFRNFACPDAMVVW
jgi:ABC-type sugar transport system ATPase subunit